MRYLALLLVILTGPAFGAGLDEINQPLCVVPETSLGVQTGRLEATDDTPNSCAGWVLWPAGEYTAWASPLSVDWEHVVWAVGATLLMWSSGLGFGWIAAILKKARYV